MNAEDKYALLSGDAFQCPRCNHYTRTMGKDKVRCWHCGVMVNGDVPDLMQMRNEEPEVYGGE